MDLNPEFPLDDGENAAVTLANEDDAAILLCDEFNRIGLIHASLADTRFVTTPTLLSVFVRQDRLASPDALDLLDTLSKLLYPTSLGGNGPARSLREGFRVDSRSTPQMRREGRTLHSRSPSRDSSARLQVRLRRLRFADAGDTASRCSWKRCSRRGSGSHNSDTRSPRRSDYDRG